MAIKIAKKIGKPTKIYNPLQYMDFDLLEVVHIMRIVLGKKEIQIVFMKLS